ncbi:MAG TPA: NAD-dependent dihydropyrimidine dehydrogenase subunit PreA [Cyanobacteria bacterium UBA8530]|nr:NAD-dependent dihydropyrimidine dehydrogenase subunit PreA [Cyanobacteria bacterium UBA8530]
MRNSVDLSVDYCGVHFENPFILAAAPPSDELEMVKTAFRMGWAGAVLKTTSVESEEVPLVYPMMSSTHLEDKNLAWMGNIDLISEHHVDEIERRVRELKKEFPNKIVITSIMGSRKEEWQSLVQRLEAAGSDMIECSFSCPQGTLGSKPGMMLGQNPEASKEVAGWVKAAAKKIPVVIKITPQVADITEIAQKLKEAGVDGLCASNTIPSLVGIDIENFVPYPNVNGKSTYSGLSGPAIKPITLRTIAEIARHCDLPITGTGGATTWSDAVEFFAVGARNIQMCTAVMQYGYRIIDDLTSGLANYMERKGFKRVSEMYGLALPNIVGHDKLPRGHKVVSRLDQELCVGCGRCYLSCRDGGHMAIRFGEDRKVAIDEEKCLGCAMCTLVCPVEGCMSLAYV